MPQYIDYGDMQRERAEIVKGAKNLALKRREKSPYAIEKQGEFIEKINAYIEKQELEKKPLTIAGFILATGIPKVSWYDLKDGKYDYVVEEYKMLHELPLEAEEYTNEDGEILPLIPWSEIIDRCYMLVQEQRETACVAGKAGNVIGNIFLLKSQHGLSDQPDQIQRQTNIQIVADAEMALKALEMCK